MSRRRQAARPSLPRQIVSGAMLTPTQEQLWRAANNDLGADDFHRRRRAHDALRLIEGQIGEAQAAEAVRRGVKETVALARARGEKVEISSGRETRERVRISSRDGLETLATAGTITVSQYRAGLVYRDLYEATDPERNLRSQMASPTFIGAGGKSAPGTAEAWAERRLRFTRSIATLEDKIRTLDRNGRALHALREVAGSARCISHFVKGGGGQALHRRALTLALDTCVVHFGLS